MATLITGCVRPEAGDLVLARVDEIGKHTRIELVNGRRAHLFPGDEIIVSFGNRYAPDQYEAVIGVDLGSCDLVAAGGIAGCELSRHQRMLPPTRITPIGLVGDGEGRRLNLRAFAVDGAATLPPIPAVLSLGTSMNAGKTTTSTALVRGLKKAGHKVAALKITGTGAGGDVWIVQDAGADIVLDFTDAGFASTYLAPLAEIEAGAYRLMNHAAAAGCDIAVIEIADGLQQLETRALIRSPAIHRVTLGTVFAAYDAMGAKLGVDVLREAGHHVLGLSGRLGRSPLGVREAEEATGLRVYAPFEIQEGALWPAIRARATLTAEADTRRRDRLAAIAARGQPIVADGLGPRASQEALRLIAEWIMASEVTSKVTGRCGTPIEAADPDGPNRRNGYRRRVWHSVIGPIVLRVPRLRRGSYRPGFLSVHGLSPAALADLLETADAPADVTAFAAKLERVLVDLGARELIRLDREELEASLRRLAARNGVPDAHSDGHSNGYSHGHHDGHANGRAEAPAAGNGHAANGNGCLAGNGLAGLGWPMAGEDEDAGEEMADGLPAAAGSAFLSGGALTGAGEETHDAEEASTIWFRPAAAAAEAAGQ